MKAEETNSLSLSEFHNEKGKKLLHWRIVEDGGRFYVYRRVENPHQRCGTGLRVKTEYLLTNGQVDDRCVDGWFNNYGEIGTAFLLNHGRTEVAGTRGFYTARYHEKLFPLDAEYNPRDHHDAREN
jgi:hypothetical protein